MDGGRGGGGGYPGGRGAVGGRGLGNPGGDDRRGRDECNRAGPPFTGWGGLARICIKSLMLLLRPYRSEESPCWSSFLN